MSDTDDASRPPADLDYATEKIIRTVDELALSDVPLPQRLRLAWLDQGERAYPPGDDIPPEAWPPPSVRSTTVLPTSGQSPGTAAVGGARDCNPLVYLACGLNAALAVGGHIYYGEGEV